MSTNYFNPTGLADTIGQADIDRYFDDDGDGVADAGLITKFSNNGSAKIDSILLGAWAPAAIVTLMANDDHAKYQGAWIVLHYACRRRKEWRDDQGRAPFFFEYDEACKFFRALQAGKERSQGETQAGTAPTVGGTLNSDVDNPPQFIFAGSPTKPAGSGGF